MWTLWDKFMRKKVIDKNEASSELSRVLTTFDLTLLGIGSTLGVGVYVLAGSVAKESAGPAVVLSFLVAALASVLAGLCYAEFGSRVPKAGSAYVYSYCTVGELIAFIVGWNLIMEYVIGVASVAKGYSGYLDQLLDHQMSKFFHTHVPIKLEYLSDYFDGFAFAITFTVAVLLAFGVKESSFFNNIFTILNLCVVVFVIVAGSMFASPKNWALDKDEILRSTNFTETQVGNGGFAPFGFHGIMKGAATCFYGFVGFDCIATTGEEAKNPQKAIPLAIIISLFCIFLAYFGISTVVTMMVPYYLQDSEAPLPEAFHNVDFTIGKWVVTIAAFFGLSTSLLGSIFPMPRVIYSMARDGVLFRFLARVHHRFHTPLIATILAGTLGGMMAAIFRLESLIDMMSIGTLTAYTLVAICVLCLRYRKDSDGADDDDSNANNCVDNQMNTIRQYLGQVINTRKTSRPTRLSSSYTNWAVIVYCLLTIGFCGVAIHAQDDIVRGEKIAVGLLAFFALGMILVLFSLSIQPVSRVKLSFKVPMVPLVPGLSILSNTYLIMKLSGITWLRFSVWMAIGFVIYGICLINGTTDKAYEESLDNKRRSRKYSKVSASGFQNVAYDYSSRSLNAIPESDRDVVNAQSGKCDTKSETETLSLKEFVVPSQGRNKPAEIPDVVNNALSKFRNVETETIEKTVEFDDTEDSFENGDVRAELNPIRL